MNDIKAFYSTYRDEIAGKRVSHKYPLRRYAHKMQYESVVRNALDGMPKGITVLDAGCGDGVLAKMFVAEGAVVTGTDISKPNIEACKVNVPGVAFLVADSEHLPLPDNSFDVVISSHVLEHLPHFEKGLSELLRVGKKRVVFAIPTIINPCSWVQVGGSQFFLFGFRSVFALFRGLMKTVWAFLTGKEGVDEGYEGRELPHVFRFPWIIFRKLEIGNWKLRSYEASSICLPFFEWFLPLVRWLDNYRARKFFRNFGYGTTNVLEKIK